MKKNPITKVLQKTLVEPFYQQNIGFFGCIVLIGVGVLYPPQLYHRAIIEFILDSNWGMIGAIMIGSLYMIKCFRFTKTQFLLPQNEFLQHLKLLSFPKRFFQLFVSQIGMMLPILLYSVGILYIAFQKNQMGAIGITIGLNLLWLIISTLTLESYLKYFNPEKSYFLNGGQHFSLFLLSYLAYYHKTRFFLTKIASIGALFAVFHFYDSADEIRVPMMAMTFAALIHFEILFDLRTFEEVELSFVRNLPVPLWKRFIWNMFVFAAILFLEICLIANQILKGRLEPHQLLIFMGFGIGLLLLIRSILLGSGMNREALVRFVFMIFVFLYFLLFFGCYLPLIGVIWGLAYSIFHYNYYKYQ
jgi:hypothetical protein